MFALKERERKKQELETNAIPHFNVITIACSTTRFFTVSWTLQAARSPAAVCRRLGIATSLSLTSSCMKSTQLRNSRNVVSTLARTITSAHSTDRPAWYLGRGNWGQLQVDAAKLGSSFRHVTQIRLVSQQPFGLLHPSSATCTRIIGLLYGECSLVNDSPSCSLASLVRRSLRSIRFTGGARTRR